MPWEMAYDVPTLAADTLEGRGTAYQIGEVLSRGVTSYKYVNHFVRPVRIAHASILKILAGRQRLAGRSHKY